MTVVSRRLVKPYPGKTELVMSRVKRFSDIAVEGGAKSRISKAIGGEMNGTIMLTNVYSSLTEATKSFESYMQNPKMAELMKERENDQSADLIGPEVFRTVYGAPSPSHNVIYLREYEINRNSVPQALEIFAEANEEFKNEDTNLLALLPLIADKMNSLYAIYYFSSIAGTYVLPPFPSPGSKGKTCSLPNIFSILFSYWWFWIDLFIAISCKAYL